MRYEAKYLPTVDWFIPIISVTYDYATFPDIFQRHTVQAFVVQMHYNFLIFTTLAPVSVCIPLGTDILAINT